MRLARHVLVDVDLAAVRRALEALLVAMDRYRAYVVPGRGLDPEQAAVVDGAAERARGLLAPSDHESLAMVEASCRLLVQVRYC